MIKPFKTILYRVGPRFPEDVQFAKRILREQVTLLSHGHEPENVVPRMLERLQPFHQRGYSHHHIQVICADAIKHLLIEKVLLERKAALS